MPASGPCAATAGKSSAAVGGRSGGAGVRPPYEGSAAGGKPGDAVCAVVSCGKGRAAASSARGGKTRRDGDVG